MLFNEPKLLKSATSILERSWFPVSVLFNEPKLLKSNPRGDQRTARRGFSALQRAEIAEIRRIRPRVADQPAVSVLFNEPKLLKFCPQAAPRAETHRVSVLFNEPKLLKSADRADTPALEDCVSVLFNEPKLLKCSVRPSSARKRRSFSALQRAEIAEMATLIAAGCPTIPRFQCSSTSRNC